MAQRSRLPRANGRDRRFAHRRLPPGVTGEPRRASVAARLGRPLGPAAAVLAYLTLPAGADGLSDGGRATAAVGVLLAVWWVTEALPLPITSLVPIVALPLSGAVDLTAATAPYANPLIALFLGGFLLAIATQRWGLHRRVALLTIRTVGTKPRQLVGGFMLATAGLSMWLSNTATMVMMLPIALSVMALVAARVGEVERVDGEAATDRFATSLLLGTAYAASIGSLATLIGTPPNAFLAAYLRQNHGIEIGFARWMAFGFPIALTLLAVAWAALVWWLEPAEIDEIPGGRELIERELRQLGPVSRGERLVLAVFLTTATLWLLRVPLQGWLGGTPLAAIDDPIIAIAAAIALFLIPVDARRGVFLLDWESARHLPWDVLLLFGGGLSLANAISTTGVDTYVGARLSLLTQLPTVVLVAILVLVVIWLTELTSNTATAATLIPVTAGVAAAAGLDPLLLTAPVALAATCAFALPVATPPNAIAFGSGRLTIGRMARAGVVLNLAGTGLITFAVVTLLQPILE